MHALLNVVPAWLLYIFSSLPACSDVDTDHRQVESLFTALTAAREKTGDKNSPNLDSFKKFVRQKTAQLRKEYACDAVEYSVEMQGGQVKLKAKPKT